VPSPRNSVPAEGSGIKVDQHQIERYLVRPEVSLLAGAGDLHEKAQAAEGLLQSQSDASGRLVFDKEEGSHGHCPACGSALLAGDPAYRQDPAPNFYFPFSLSLIRGLFKRHPHLNHGHPQTAGDQKIA